MLGAWSFDAGGLPPNPPPRPPDSSIGAVGFTAPGLLEVHYGRDCADAVGQKGKSKTYFLPTSLRQEYVLPGYADQAVVLLNGWELQYKGSDKHVGGVGVGIGEISLAGGKLRWVAEGHLSENGLDEAYSFCYSYVVVAWDGAKLDLAGDQTTAYRTDQKNRGADSPLTANGGFAPTPAAINKRTVAVLPLGFYFSFDDDDHHLLQLAYDLGPHARYLGRRDDSFAYNMRACAPVAGGYRCNDLPPPAVVATASRLDQGHVSWISSGILRDNRVRPYWFFDQMTVLSGDDVTLIEPPFAIVPVAPRSGECPQRAGKEQTVDVEILDLPFEYAVPMLTGWELRYYCNDEEVKRLGLHIHDVTYNAPGTAKGTLRYKVTGWLHDDDDRPGFRMRHKAHILGFDFGPD
jgi:hypothetical protein